MTLLLDSEDGQERQLGYSLLTKRLEQAHKDFKSLQSVLTTWESAKNEGENGKEKCLELQEKYLTMVMEQLDVINLLLITGLAQNQESHRKTKDKVVRQNVGVIEDIDTDKISADKLSPILKIIRPFNHKDEAARTAVKNFVYRPDIMVSELYLLNRKEQDPELLKAAKKKVESISKTLGMTKDNESAKKKSAEKK